MGVIFLGSTSLGNGENTGNFLLPILKSLLPWATREQLLLLHALLRKGGHFTEYAILSWLWHRAFIFHGRSGSAAWRALGSSVGYALFDEIHQGWTGVRGASAGDVLIDGMGAATALLVIRFGGVAAAQRLTQIFLWIAALGGTPALLLNLLAGVPGGWLWVTAPAAGGLLLWRRWLRRQSS
jgi:VanZ family protein